jgi:hypothetical protein
MFIFCQFSLLRSPKSPGRKPGDPLAPAGGLLDPRRAQYAGTWAGRIPREILSEKTGMMWFTAGLPPRGTECSGPNPLL